MSNYFAEKYGDPDWGKMKQPDYPKLVADAAAQHPDATRQQLLNIIMTEQGGKTNPNAVADELRKLGRP